MSSDSDETIMSVAELIDNAFGDDEVNIVHHKLLQTVLYLLARQLRVLERRVAVQIGPMHRSTSSLSVTEVKLHAMLKKKKKIRSKSTSKSIDITSANKTPDVKFTTRRASAKTVEKTPGSKVTTEKSLRQKSPSEKTDKTSSDKTSTDKTSSDKTSTDKTSSDKTSTDKTSSYKTSSYKTSSDKTSTDKASPRDKTSSEKPSTDKTSSDKGTADKKSTSISTTDKTMLLPLSTDEELRIKDTDDKKITTVPDKALTDKSLTRKLTADKTSASKPSDKTPTVKTSSGKAASKDKSYGKEPPKLEKKASTYDAEHTGLQDYQKTLEQIELKRERELRVIHQRANSREEYEKTPTPIASLDSVEATYEKLLVVERVPAEEARARAAREKSGTQNSQGGPRLSVVTQDQFEQLAFVVRQLQEKLAPIATPEFPENAQLMNELRKGASLTDAMAALQLSARLEAAEKTLKNMLSLLTELASQTSDLNLISGPTDDIEVLYGAPGDKSRQSGAQVKSMTSTKKKSLSPGRSKKGTSVGGSPSLMSITLPQSTVLVDTSVTGADVDFQELKKDRVTYEELDTALQEMQDEIMKKVNASITRSAANADTALRIANKLEGRIESSLDLGHRMEELENLVANYVEQINVLDTSLSSEMTNYQEELTQMQHDLEVGLETMADALANTGGDATAVAELNAHFSDLQAGIDETVSRQKELRDIQSALSVDLDALRKQIEVLRETKSDREEVVDALRDKAGLGALNGLVSHTQFDAVRGDFEKRIGTAYDKFNNQEVAWQKAIDDLWRELNEKADMVQVEGLRDEIYRYLVEFRNRVKFIMDIVGEPNAAALSKRLNRDTACLSCAAPAHMKAEEPSGMMLPAMRPATIGAETSKPKEDGDHRVCIPGQPIPHPIDPRSHVCQRWCGGSHTLMKNTALSRAPLGMIITQAKRGVTTEQGADGKPYAVDKPRVPCSQCILPTAPPSPEHSDHQENPTANGDSELIPYHMCPGYVSHIDPDATTSVTSAATVIVSD